MEEMFNTFISRVSQAGQESYGLKETVELYKSRGEMHSGGVETTSAYDYV